MIKDERQYRITKAQAAKFEHAIKRQPARGPAKKIHPLLQKAEVDALRSQLADLRAELKEYEASQAKKRSARKRSRARRTIAGP